MATATADPVALAEPEDDVAGNVAEEVVGVRRADQQLLAPFGAQGLGRVAGAARSSPAARASTTATASPAGPARRDVGVTATDFDRAGSVQRVVVEAAHLQQRPELLPAVGGMDELGHFAGCPGRPPEVDRLPSFLVDEVEVPLVGGTLGAGPVALDSERNLTAQESVSDRSTVAVTLAETLT